jgi:acetyl esterase/lipase
VNDVRPQQPVYLWAEKPRIVPDRESIKDQRIHAVDNPSLIPFWPDSGLSAVPAVLIFPGGGYTRLAINHEGIDIAQWFAARGVAAFVVKYRLHEYGFPAPILDGLRAVRLVRQQAQAWGVDPGKVGVVGFSAGGHVAASLVTDSVRDICDDELMGDISARPDFAVLGYPVITMEGVDAHAGSRKALLGDDPDPGLVRQNSLQYQVGYGVPPVFMFHGVDDRAVPVTNSLAFFTEVQKYNPSSELHLYQTSIHGVGMIQGQGSVSSWPQALELWLKQGGWLL